MKRVEFKKKVVTGLVLATTMLATFSGSLALLPTTASAAQIIGGAVADDSSPRSITIWKYEIKDVSELGSHGVGEKVTTDKEPLEGIEFKIQRVQPVGDTALTDPVTQKVGTAYTIDSSFADQTIKTAADGSAKLDLGQGKANDGIYLVTEVADSRVAKPADPFFVYVPQTKRDDLSSLIYDVEVQPKNILAALINPDKTVEGGKGYSIKAGQTFDWEATANIPNGLYSVASENMTIKPLYDDAGNEIPAPNDTLSVTKGDKIYANYFTMSDTIAKELAIESVKVEIKKGTGEWEPLSLGTEYKVSINGTDQTTAPITADAGADNKVVMSLENAGMEKAQSYDKIRVVYTTTTDKDYNGVIENAFDVAFKTPGQKPVTPPSENNPKYYTGGFDIEKTGEDTKAALAGAIFHIAESKKNADSNIFLALDGKSYGKADGTGSLKDAVDAATAAGTTLLTSTTDASGKATFNGLKLNWSANEADPTSPVYAEADIKRSYWVVETTAPDGYELLKESKEVEVTLSTKTTVALNVVDKKKTILPFTGGAGTTLLVVIAVGAISVGAVAITIDKKKRQAN